MDGELDKIYQAFTEAVELYNQGMESITNGASQLRSAEHKIETAMQDFAQYMGTQEFSSENFPDGGLSLLGRLTRGTKDFSSFFDIGSLF
jgi:hypothetical protein